MAMTKPDLDAIISGAGSIAISGHIRPDGDCVGSCLALQQYIRTWYPQKVCRVYLQTIPDTFGFLAGADEIVHEADDRRYDVFFALDLNDIGRLGEFGRIFSQAGHTVCVDHHIFHAAMADESYIIPESSSTCEVLCSLLDEEKITHEMAEALYLGIAHDTGVFQYDCTHSSTMRCAAMLMDKQIDHARILEDTYFTKSWKQKQLLGRMLFESIRLMDGRIAAGFMKKKDMVWYEAQSSDLDGFASELRTIKGVECAIFMYEVRSGEWKVSLRSSRQVDVDQIASLFGGGGHARAAGCMMSGQAFDVINALTGQIALQLDGQS